MRALVLLGAEPQTDTASLVAYGRRVLVHPYEHRLSNQAPGDGELTLGINIKVSESENETTMRDGTLVVGGTARYEVDDRVTRRVFLSLDQESREAMAHFVADEVAGRLNVAYERQLRWDLLPELPARIETLKRQVLEGKLPLPPTLPPPLS